MNQHSSDNVETNQKKKLIILIAGIVVLALALGTVGTLWYMKQTERTKAARRQCEIKVAQVSKANAVWKSLVHNSVITDLTKGDSDNAKELAKIMSEKVPDAVSCTANSPEELGSQSAEALAASEWYAVKAKRVRELAVTLLDENSKKDKDKDKDKQNEETKKQEINESTGIVIQRSNVVPPKPKPTPAPTKNNQDTKKQKTEEKPKTNSNTKNPPCKKGDKNCTSKVEENTSEEGKGNTEPGKKGNEEGKGSTEPGKKGNEDGAGAKKPKGNGQEDPNGKAKKGNQDSSAKTDLVGPPPSSESPQKP
ncbi:ATPase [Gardnerella swidsinskii]|uniref:ATPase n=1 Tax=Gardnerella swidsinskii TaxID=2792979 RepID=UPI0036F4A28C